MRRLSLRRRLIVDMMHASSRVPFVGLKRTIGVRALVDARNGAAEPPGWAAIFAKAFSIAARDEPVLRTLYLGWPWPRLYEINRSVGMIAIARRDGGEESVLPQKLTGADAMPLREADRLIRFAQTAPARDVAMFRKLLRLTRIPLPLRRLLWAYGLNSGRQRSNFAGTFGITSVSAFGAGELHAISPGPYLLTYGAVTENQTIDVLVRWDHRVTDAAVIAKLLTNLEKILNTEIADELSAPGPLAAEVGRTDHAAAGRDRAVIDR